VNRPLTVCIVTADIVGPVRNGGIGTAYYNLAVALAGGGHQVTVLYAPGQYCENRTIAHWRRHYRRLGITFVPAPPTAVEGHPAIRMSHAVYEWLKTRHFDIVHCHEWRGVGFYTALAKRQGLCLENSVLCVGAHSPVLWHLEGMNELADPEALEVDFMERESVARADVLWTPSRHMEAWLRREGWPLPSRIYHQPYLLLGVEPSASGDARPGSELVFFGRLETRKGLDLFADALDRVVARGGQVSSVTFLGKLASVGGVPSTEYLERRAARWPFPWKILDNFDRDAAMAYLKSPNRVAVLPSRIDNLPYTVLECLGARIPFVAASTGGIPEMIRPADRARVLFEPTADALAATLSEVLRAGHAAVRPLHDPARTLANWLAWHDREGRRPARRARPARRVTRTPLVSVCMTHRNRAALVGEALASIERQDYPRIEVVLVDDGSDQPAAIGLLDALEVPFAARGWSILRQPNRYPGAARNAAIARATGEYILFMDDDNVARPDEVRTLVAAAERARADIVACFLHVFQGVAPRPDEKPPRIWPFLGAALGPGLLRNVFGDANALYRRDVFDRIGGFTEDFGVGCEDWEFLARAALRGLRLEVVPEALVAYRQSPRGVQQSTPDAANRMRARRPYLGLLPAHLRPLVHLARDHTRTISHAGGEPARLDQERQAVVFGTGSAGPVDLVIVASLAGKAVIATQLERMGLEPGRQFVHFLDPVRRGNLVTQIQL
jgi:glycosyltransferase involved in cell wall biosynthesis/GT2 family glycosyltransferase